MKHFIYTTLALAAVFTISCNKVEKEIVEAPAGTPIVIRASVDDEVSKTMYTDGKTFSWVAGDKIALEVVKDGSYDVITLTAEAGGRSVSFSGTVPEGYTACDYALYPKRGAKADYYSSDLGIQDNGSARLWGTITPDLDNPMGSIPLIGKKQADGTYRFRTATGILKITVENIPGDAYFFQLDATDGTALNGNFSFGDDCTLYMSNVEYPWPQKYVSFTPEAAGETRTFYLPIPVGTIPAGMVASVSSTSRGNIVLATTSKDIAVTRNKVLDLGTLRVPDEEWVSLGNGTFIDNFIWPFAGLTDYATAEFQQSSTNSNKFRIAKPYPGSNSDEWFYFDVTDPTKVASDDYFVDVEVTKDNQTFFKPWVRNGHDYGYYYSDVLKWQDSGLPANIEIGPCYRGELFDTEGYAYEIGKDHDPLAIEIVFPGCEPYKKIGPAAGQITLTSDMLSAAGTASYEGGGIPALVDGLPNTYWHSDYYYAVTDNDPVYGIWIDIALNEAIQKFHFAFITRNTNSNASPTQIAYGVSNDGQTWTKLGEESTNVTTSTGGAVTITLGAQDAGAAYKYLRFGIIESTDAANYSNSFLGDLNFEGWKKSVNMAELMLFAD